MTADFECRQCVQSCTNEQRQANFTLDFEVCWSLSTCIILDVLCILKLWSGTCQWTFAVVPSDESCEARWRNVGKCPPTPRHRDTQSVVADCALTVMCIGGKDKENERKQRLLNIFGDWTDMVTDLIRYAKACSDCLHPSCLCTLLSLALHM